MKLKWFSVICTLLVVLTGSAFGAVTGKITGVVTDAANEQPLIGVSVSVQGTTWGAITDEEGRYTILNVPVGTYTLVMSAVGYATVEISNVEVHADLASYQSQALTAEAAELGTTISVRAETPLIVRDKTTTVNIIRREEFLALPTRGFDQVVGIQNSVVRMNTVTNTRQRGLRENSGTAPELNLRGGRPSEVAYYVDGFSQQDPLTGLSTANISNNAVKEISVVSGAFSAEYGHVASGIVNVVTNSGTDEYHGNIDVLTDNIAKGQHKSFDHNYYSADFGGPIPGLENGYFFFSGERRWLGDRMPSSKTEETFTKYGTPFGLDGGEELQRLPNNSQGGWSYQGKIDYNFTPNLKLALNGNGSIDRWQDYRHRWVFNSENNRRYKDKNLGLNAKMTYTYSANVFGNLSASYFVTERFRGDGLVFDDLAAYQRSYTNPEDDDEDLFRLPDSYYPNYLKRKSEYIGFKGDVTDQWNAYLTSKFGFDFQRHTLRYFENLRATNVAGYSDKNVNRYGYDMNAEESDTLSWQSDAKHPINLGMYLQNRFEWRGLIVNAGLRFDYFDYKSLRIKDLDNPLDPGNATGVDTLDRSDLEDSEKFTRVSPRLGISFPISDVTQMHINYGKFFQRPDLRRLYLGYDFWGDRIGAGSYYPFASPNLEPEKTTQYEVGVTHRLGENAVFTFTAYYKDVTGLTQIFKKSPASPFSYDFFANSDFGTIKGVDLGFTLRRTRNLMMDLKYTLSYASGTGSYSGTSYNIAWVGNKDDWPRQVHPLDYDQRHNLVGIFDFRTTKGEGPMIGDYYPLENFGVNVLVQFKSGIPYTPVTISNEITTAAYNPTPVAPLNSANLPWTFTIDLKAERFFEIADYRITPYVIVKNLLDRDNEIAVYEGTGKANTTGWLETEPGQQFVNTYGDEKYLLKQSDPLNYSNPRMILFGLRASF